MKFFNFQKTQRRQTLYKETRKVFISIILSSIMIGFPIVIARDNENFWVEFIQLRESKFGKNEQYLNKLSECRMIADNFLKIKKEEEKPLTNQEDRKEKNEDSLLNYEYDENDDGADWET